MENEFVKTDQINVGDYIDAYRVNSPSSTIFSYAKPIKIIRKFEYSEGGYLVVAEINEFTGTLRTSFYDESKTSYLVRKCSPIKKTESVIPENDLVVSNRKIVEGRSLKVGDLVSKVFPTGYHATASERFPEPLRVSYIYEKSLLVELSDESENINYPYSISKRVFSTSQNDFELVISRFEEISKQKQTKQSHESVLKKKKQDRGSAEGRAIARSNAGRQSSTGSRYQGNPTRGKSCTARCRKGAIRFSIHR